MNIDRGKESFTEEEIGDLRTRLLDYRNQSGLSWSTVAARTGVAQGTISQWVPGVYRGDNQSIAAKVHRFFLKQAAQDEIERLAAPEQNFLVTRTSRNITSMLRWAQRGKFCVIVGEPGIGKTVTFEQYAAMTTNVWNVQVQVSDSSVNACMHAILRAMGVKREGGAGYALNGLLRKHVMGKQGLLIMDEAQHLTEAAIELLRGLYDGGGLGLVLSGNMDVQTRVDGSKGASFAQRHSRVSMRHVLKVPHLEDVAMILSSYGVEKPKEREFLQGIAMKPGDGALRAMVNVIELASFIANLADEEERCLDHFKEARMQIRAGA